MLNRRYLRVKVLQALYAWFRTPDADMNRGENQMFKSVDKIYDLYFLLLQLIVEVKDAAIRNVEQSKEKRLPSEEDLNPNTRFIDNLLIHAIENNPHYKREIANRKISWQNEQDMAKKIFRQIKASEAYEKYMLGGKTNDFEEDKRFVVKIFRDFIAQFDLLESFLEEQDIHWYDDMGLVSVSIIKTIQKVEANDQEGSFLLRLYKDEADDVKFLKDLYRKTILNNDQFEKMIEGKIRNWEIERIALMDKILMKMGICEFLFFPTIPVKVTINEYLELSKGYSTPRSKIFINGILDKLLIDLKAEGKVKKQGRGLVD